MLVTAGTTWLVIQGKPFGFWTAATWRSSRPYWPSCPTQELWLTRYYRGYRRIFRWNLLARVTSLTHLSLPGLQMSDGLPSFIFSFQYLHVHVALILVLQISLRRNWESRLNKGGQAMVEVRQHWLGIVIEHITTRWRKFRLRFEGIFLLNVNKVLSRIPEGSFVFPLGFFDPPVVKYQKVCG